MDTTFLTDAIATLRCVARSIDNPSSRLPEVIQDEMNEAVAVVQQGAQSVGELLVDIELWNRQNK